MEDNMNSEPIKEQPGEKHEVQMSLYEINRQMIGQLPAFEDSQWEGARRVLSDWMENIHNEYFLLYGREINYFTLFKRENNCEASLFDCLKECFASVGAVHAFDVTEDKQAIEIWAEAKTTENETAMTCLYLFNYDDGVVAFG